MENRISGDELLDAQDLIDEIKGLGGQVDEYGYITLYHRTSASNAASIRATSEMVAKEEDGLFFSTKQEGQNVGYGDTVVTFSIPAEKLLLDDIFDDEAHLRFPLKKPGRVSMKEYLVGDGKKSQIFPQGRRRGGDDLPWGASLSLHAKRSESLLSCNKEQVIYRTPLKRSEKTPRLGGCFLKIGVSFFARNTAPECSAW